MKNNLLLIFSIFTFFLIGCYSYKYIETNVFNRNKIINFKYDIILIKEPSLSDPSIEFKVIRYPIFQNEKILKLQEVAYYSNVKTSLLLVTSGLGLLAVGGIMVSLDENKLGVPGTIIGISGLAVSTIGFLTGTSKKDTSYFTGNIKDTVILIGVPYVSKEYEVIRNKDLKVLLRSDKKTKEIITDLEIYKVNLVNDLNLARFRDPKDLDIYLTLQEYNFSKKITLNSKLWTREFVKINIDNVPVYDSAGNQVGTLRYGEEYKLVYKDSDLWIIEISGNERYIEPNVGEIFWSVPKNK